MRIVLNAALQVARLADIERVTPAVEHAVDAGAARHVAQRRAQDRNSAGDADGVARSGRRLARYGLRLLFGAEIAGAAARIERHRRPPSPRPGRRHRRRKRLSRQRIFGQRIFGQRFFLVVIHIHGRWG